MAAPKPLKLRKKWKRSWPGYGDFGRTVDVGEPGPEVQKRARAQGAAREACFSALRIQEMFGLTPTYIRMPYHAGRSIRQRL